MHADVLARISKGMATHNATQVDERMKSEENRVASFNYMKVQHQLGAKNIPRHWSDQHSRQFASSGWYHSQNPENASDWITCYPCGFGARINNNSLEAVNENHDTQGSTSNCTQRLARERKVTQSLPTGTYIPSAHYASGVYSTPLAGSTPRAAVNITSHSFSPVHSSQVLQHPTLRQSPAILTADALNTFGPQLENMGFPLENIQKAINDEIRQNGRVDDIMSLINRLDTVRSEQVAQQRSNWYTS